MKRFIALLCAFCGMFVMLAGTPTPAHAADTVTLTGVVRDGGAHGWPLWATVSVGGVSAQTSPVTGRYSLVVPQAASYDLHVSSPGYQEADESIAGRSADVTLAVDADACRAPGYQYATDGLIEGFDSGSTPAGWSVQDGVGQGWVWRFDDPGKVGNHTGGQGGFAVMDDEYYTWQAEDSTLVSPVVDLSKLDAPSIGFANDFTMWDYTVPSGIGDVDVSIDGGATWTNVWRDDLLDAGPKRVDVPMPMAAHQPDVRVRFHYYTSPDVTAGRWWAIDDVFIGDRRCDAVPGGMVAGRVTDANTADPVGGARIAGPSGSTTSDANGWYSMFAPGQGSQAFVGSKLQYHDLKKSVTVAADQVTKNDVKLPTGQISVVAAVTTTPALGGSGRVPLTLTNTGTAAAQVTLAERPGDFQLAQEKGAPWSGLGAPPAAGWSSLPDYPIDIRDNVAGAYGGRIYSFGGVSSSSQGQPVAASYVYDPGTRAWSQIASMPQARLEGVGAFIGDRFYVVDGATGSDGLTITGTLDIYDAGTNTWSTGAPIPVPEADAAATVLDGQLYVVGGCDNRAFCGTSGVFRYDPASGAWQRLPDYPTPESWLGCGAIEGVVYCAGGQQSFGTVSTATYAYDPAANTWTSRARVPMALWAMGYSVANGKLLISGGVNSGLSTNKGFAYDPVSDTWSALPDSLNQLTRGAMACGVYKIGGAQSFGAYSPYVETLPGYADCGSDRDAAWLSLGGTSVTLQPNQSARVWVKVDASVVSQPGTYDAALLVRSDTPYGVGTVDVSMLVSPPGSWTEVMGTISGTGCDGTTKPLAGANVWIAGKTQQTTLTTDTNGRYALWVDQRESPLQLTAGGDGWTPKVVAKMPLKGARAAVQDLTVTPLQC
jgi:hypothetical protein